jgi:23S rRNA pseudouridine1911/1915/1917 synthase
MQKIVNETEFNQRADVLLANRNTEYSRAALAKLFAMGKITKDGKVIKAGEKISPNMYIEADISEISKKVDVIPLPILYEDENIIVIDKPAGIISHARGKYWDEASVASFVRDRVSGIEGERAGIVHRLDRATSGVMICAKNQETVSFLQKQFSDRKVNKTYIAIIEHELSPEEGVIDVPLARNPNDPKTFRPDVGGKPAITEYHTVEHTNKQSIVRLHPLTGRTHQLRVHLQYMKHPIIGDELYGGKKADRLFLHAHTIEITVPGGERKTFTAPLPSEFTI